MKRSIFDEVIDRQNTSSEKWDALSTVYGTSDALPMWVADMDFPIPKEVQEALYSRISHPVFGYTFPSHAIDKAIQKWLKNRHDWQIESEWIGYSAGVVSGIGTSISAFTNPGDQILIQSPVYKPFFDMIEHLDRKVVNSPLLINNARFEIDFIDFEEKLKSGVKLFLLCSPHNPGGRVWSKEELIKIGELCDQYDVLIVSDEIHADLALSHSKHIPIASLSNSVANRTITLMAPSKTFNIAGLQASLLLASNLEHKKQIEKIQIQNAFHGVNLLGLTAMEAAYQYGEPWLNELLPYIEENIQVAEAFIAKELPTLNVMHPDASFLIWIDCRSLGWTDEKLQDTLLNKGKLALEPGPKYGQGGEGFVRMNIGCPRSVLLEGLERLKRALS
ncbi:MalY/PatB family protein [Peribacillus loiseleuriae]|uniref:MalY/PatB family protein n=1 Tax=Peribacillus loiseleuriae TaxID=1679170 RepID=UPI0037F8615A